MNHEQLRTLIVRPVLKRLEKHIPYSEAAVELLMMTAAHESRLGEYIHQVGGIAKGIYQMEQATADDIETNYLSYRPEMDEDILQMMCCDSICDNLVGNLYYSTAMARVHYFRDKEPLPEIEDFTGLGAYAKRVWNTEMGKATQEDYLVAYNRLCISPSS